MKSSTNKLNQAIERMTTGFKINHAKDNAANYSISTNMTTKIGAYNVAEDNAAMGLDLISTAEGTLSQIEDKLQRLRALAEQAANGTYGEQSLNAINAEANALVDEINRLYSTAEYNGLKLFGPEEASQAAPIAMFAMNRSATSEGGFIQEIAQRDTSGMDKLSDVDPATTISGGTYSISTVDELKQLATMTNNGKITGGEFVLANDIDLSDESTWTPIGNTSAHFQASFDGNGYVIKNLTATMTNENAGLFGVLDNAEIKNLGLENINIVGSDSSGVGTLAGMTMNTTTIDNCYATGSIDTANAAGGLIGVITQLCIVKNSWSDVDISNVNTGGGLVAASLWGTCDIDNCYTLGDIDATCATGLTYQYCFDQDGSDVGMITSITNSFSMGKITGSSDAAGVVACGQDIFSDSVSNCYYNSELNPSINGLLAEYTNYAPASSAVGKTTAELQAMIPTLYNYPSGLPDAGGTGGAGTGGLTPAPDTIMLQVGVASDSASQIGVNTSFVLTGVDDLRMIGLDTTTDYLTQIDDMLALVSEKQTHFGATSNRLESVLEEITIQRDNLVSSRSTIRDADIAEVSSHYIQQQILQQASTTLLATANQSPSIALQLI